MSNSSTEPKKISIDSASIIDLKAELLKKQEEYKLKKLDKAKNNEYEVISSKIKKTQIWDKKQKREKPNVTATTKSNVNEDKEQEISIEEDELLKKSKRVLESKAKYYDEVVKGSVIPEEGDEELFLVDFEKKYYQKKLEDDEDDEYKFRSNEKFVNIGFDYDNPSANRNYNNDKSVKVSSNSGTTEDEYKEKLHEKWESERIANAEKTNLHYHDIKYDEARELGVGHFQFSSREEERKNQMKYFEELKTEANKGRLNIQQEKKSRENALKERLRKVKQKRLLKEGYSLEEIDEVFRGEDEAELELAENEMKKVQEKEEREREEEAKIDERKKSLPILDREWDKPKLKEPMWNRIVENIRQERVTDFAPPQNYEPKAKKKKQKNKVPPGDIKKNQFAPPYEQTSTDTLNIPLPSPTPTNFFHPPYMSIPPPNMSIPPPNMSIPPPNMSIPPPNFMFPPPHMIPSQVPQAQDIDQT